jgi:hypothetical protein
MKTREAVIPFGNNARFDAPLMVTNSRDERPLDLSLGLELFDQAFGLAGIDSLAVLPGFPWSEDGHGHTRDPIVASSDCSCRRSEFFKSGRTITHHPTCAQ